MIIFRWAAKKENRKSKIHHGAQSFRNDECTVLSKNNLLIKLKRNIHPSTTFLVKDTSPQNGVVYSSRFKESDRL